MTASKGGSSENCMPEDLRLALQKGLQREIEDAAREEVPWEQVDAESREQTKAEGMVCVFGWASDHFPGFTFKIWHHDQDGNHTLAIEESNCIERPTLESIWIDLVRAEHYARINAFKAIQGCAEPARQLKSLKKLSATLDRLDKIKSLLGSSKLWDGDTVVHLIQNALHAGYYWALDDHEPWINAKLSKEIMLDAHEKKYGTFDAKWSRWITELDMYADIRTREPGLGEKQYYGKLAERLNVKLEAGKKRLLRAKSKMIWLFHWTVLHEASEKTLDDFFWEIYSECRPHMSCLIASIQPE